MFCRTMLSVITAERFFSVCVHRVYSHRDFFVHCSLQNSSGLFTLNGNVIAHVRLDLGLTFDWDILVEINLQQFYRMDGSCSISPSAGKNLFLKYGDVDPFTAVKVCDKNFKVLRNEIILLDSEEKNNEVTQVCKNINNCV